MAEIIPSLNTIKNKMTAGERRLAERISTLLEDDYLCWYDIPLGNKSRYPDFIVLHPSRGLLLLEVKDWKQETMKSINKQSVELITNSGLKTVANPLEQARQYAYQVINRFENDTALKFAHGPHKGKQCFPYGYGVVFTNITRKVLERSGIYQVIPELSHDSQR
jgi:Nuclease-related domain